MSREQARLELSPCGLVLHLTCLGKATLRIVGPCGDGEVVPRGETKWVAAGSEIELLAEADARDEDGGSPPPTRARLVICGWRHSPRSPRPPTEGAVTSAGATPTGAAPCSQKLYAGLGSPIDREGLGEWWANHGERHKRRIAKSSGCGPAEPGSAEGSGGTAEGAVWVECNACCTWSLLPPGTRAESLPDEWLCRMHPDANNASCTAAAERALVASAHSFLPRVRDGGQMGDEKKKRVYFSLTRVE